MAEPAYRGSWLPLTAESICNGMTKEAGFVAPVAPAFGAWVALAAAISNAGINAKR